MPGLEELLRFLLLLLADADFEVLLLCVLERLMIVARHDVRQVLVNVGILGQDRHHGEAFVAGRAEWAETLDVGNCHTCSV